MGCKPTMLMIDGTTLMVRFGPRRATAASAAASVSGAQGSVKTSRNARSAAMPSVLDGHILERRRIRDLQRDRLRLRWGRRKLHPNDLRFARFEVLVPAVVPVRVERGNVLVFFVL